ncbi:MAG: GNAT family N-acetyltransferase [Planctomycetota bacterium]|jgi:GNAT superfamily N-acetyltransferase|nr:GNAT family N-acetyltransferase [Planctomycetota bacterium]
MPDTANFTLATAGLSDQGSLGPFLLAVCGPVRGQEIALAGAAHFPTSSLEDELMAADDFYFSQIDLMDCCFLAKVGTELVGAACLNPYVAELEYLAVNPAWRRRGIGKALFQMVRKEASRRRLDHLRVEASLALADPDGLAFLETLGFGEIRRTALLGMAIPLAPAPNP